jgi:hypothetical protein
MAIIRRIVNLFRRSKWDQEVALTSKCARRTALRTECHQKRHAVCEISVGGDLWDARWFVRKTSESMGDQPIQNLSKTKHHSSGHARLVLCGGAEARH